MDFGTEWQSSPPFQTWPFSYNHVGCRLRLSRKINPHFHLERERVQTFCHLAIFANFSSTRKYALIGIVFICFQKFPPNVRTIQTMLSNFLLLLKD